MHPLITRCPSCQTSFQVSTAQLRAADGNVRCGACLNVFVASDNFSDGIPLIQPAQTATETEESQAPAFESAAQTRSGSDSLTEPGWELLEDAPDPEEIYSEEAADDDVHTRMYFEENPGRVEPLLFASRASTFTADLHDDHVEPFSRTNRAALHEFSEPVELRSAQKNRPALLKVTGAAILALLMLAGIGLQLIWFKRDALSLQPEWRPRIEWMCTQLPCTVPAQRDLSAIRSENLVVRSHPDTENALLISLSFRNEATFAQPFPSVTLKFTDKDQNPVATRSFIPQEYLEEELRHLQLMPPGASINARMDIVDPGSAAINYEVFLGSLDKQ
jgi:predicted Zn finger-like uncharacterized protein